MTSAFSEVLRCRPAITGYLGLGPRARGVDQLSRMTRARVQMPVESTTFPGDSGPSRRVRVVDQAFGRLRPVPEGPRFRPTYGRLWTMLGAVVLNSYPRELALGLWAPGVNQRSP